MIDARFHNKQIGLDGEILASHYLISKGYEILENNYRNALGEIDLVTQERSEIVFVEVKTRKSSRFGRPEESVDNVKQQKIQKAAEIFLIDRQLIDYDWRLDVIAIELDANGKVKNLEHFKNVLEN